MRLEQPAVFARTGIANLLGYAASDTMPGENPSPRPLNPTDITMATSRKTNKKPRGKKQLLRQALSVKSLGKLAMVGAYGAGQLKVLVPTAGTIALVGVASAAFFTAWLVVEVADIVKGE